MERKSLIYEGRGGCNEKLFLQKLGSLERHIKKATQIKVLTDFLPMVG